MFQYIIQCKNRNKILLPNDRENVTHVYIYKIIYIHTYKYISLSIYLSIDRSIFLYKSIYNKPNDGEKVNLFYLKLKIFILIIYKINKYLKSVFTLNMFQDFIHFYITAAVITVKQSAVHCLKPHFMQVTFIT